MTYDIFMKKYAMSLNSQQEAVVQAVNGPVLLLAVPGSGKTTVLVTRLGYMLYCCGIQPSEILTMTYTKAATKDMQRRFTQIFGNRFINDLEFRTINSVSARIIQYYERIKNRTAFKLVDEKKLEPVIREIFFRITSSFPSESDIKAVKSQITYVKNNALTELEIKDIELDEIDFLSIYKEYCRTLLDKQWMDYDDQILYAYQIITKFPDIRQYYQSTYRYVCVDEAQDTSKIQHNLVKLLTQEHKNLFMVGDEDQSIYGFRAAYPKALLEFEKEYPGANVLLMEKNYRSTQQIIIPAANIINKNIKRHPKCMVSNREDGKPIEQIWVHDRDAQYWYLAKEAQKYHQKTAVLYRDNDCALPIIDIFNRKGIAYQCPQLESSFFSHFIVRDITDIIRFAYDQTDRDLFLRIYYKFSAGFSKAAVNASLERYRESHGSLLQSLLEVEELPQWSREQAKALQIQLNNLQKDSAEDAIRRILFNMGYGNFLKERKADQNKVSILISLAKNESSPQRLLSRLNELFEIVKCGPSDTKCNLVLSTIHSSKGLEYYRVILLDVLDGILPKASLSDEKTISPDDLDKLEEERRLFYVAITRAKDELSVFRYKDKSLASSFAEELFSNIQKKTAHTKFTQPKPKQISSYAHPKDVTTHAKEYVVDRKVIHKVFGMGTIVGKRENIVTIYFENETVKDFDLNGCLRQGLLKLPQLPIGGLQ